MRTNRHLRVWAGAAVALALATIAPEAPSQTHPNTTPVILHPGPGSTTTTASTSAPAAPMATTSTAPAPTGSGPTDTAAPSNPYTGHHQELVERLIQVATAVHDQCPAVSLTNAQQFVPIAERVLSLTQPPKTGRAPALTDDLARQLFPESYPADKRNETLKKLQDKAVRAALQSPVDKVEAAVKTANLEPFFKSWVDEIPTVDNDLVRRNLCTRYGAENVFGSKPGFLLDLTVFRDEVRANAAVVADYPSVKKIEDDIARLAASAKKYPDRLGRRADPLAAVLSENQSGGGPYEALAGLAVNFTELALTGLAKLIVERAKYETVAWALDQVGKDICVSDDNDPAGVKVFKTEMSTYWAPRLCTRARTKLLWQYGTSTATLEALRADIEADVRSWPGNAVGLGLDAAFKGTVKSVCSDKGPPAACSGLPGVELKLRTQTAARLTAILDGKSAPMQLKALGADLEGLNRYTNADKKPAFWSPEIAMLACAATLPERIGTIRPILAIRGTDEARTRAAVLAGLASSTACLNVVGKGKVLVDACFSDPTTCSAPVTYFSVAGTGQSADFEKLTTIARLDLQVGGAMANIDAHALALKAAIENVKTTATTAKAAVEKWKDVKPPAIDASALGKGESASEILQKYLDDVTTVYELQAVRDHLNAALGVADASVGLTEATVDALLTATSFKELLPGLCEGSPAACAGQEETQATLKTVRDQVEKLEGTLKVFHSIVAYDWSHAVSDGLALLQQSFPEDDVTAQKIGRMGIFLSGVLSAHNGDEMATALDAIASPPGGWRRKQIPGTFTVSFSAFPSLYGGSELRLGKYVAEEKFNHAYPVMPALTLPVGLDLAWATKWGTFGMFLPLLDPAGFLQYDVEKDAKLPGASLKTALAFGLGVRFAPKETPFNVMFMLPFYRPGFRQDTPDATGTGADVFQIGVALGVDVTLLDLASKLEAPPHK